MAHQLRAALFGCAVAVALAACTDQPTREPTAPALRSPNLTLSLPPSICDITALKAYARDYAASNKDPLNSIISALQGETNKNGIGAVSTTLAFDGLARLAVMRGNSGLQKSTALVQEAFDGLVKGFVGCMIADIRNTAVAEDFAPAVGPNWLFEVLGSPGATPPTVAYQTATGLGNPYWSAQLANTPSTRFLIYGYFPATPQLPVTVGSEIEIRTIPTIASDLLAATFTIGLCNIGSSSFNASLRLNHNKTIVALQTPTCGRDPSLATVSPPSVFGRLHPTALAHAALDFFGPKPLHAAAVQGFGAVGGSVSELSPSAVYDLSLIALGGLGTIAGGPISQELSLVGGGSVTIVATEAGDAREGIPVVMAILGNSSSIAFFTDAQATDPNLVTPTVTRLTDANGVADFAGVRLTKAGGYQLSFHVGIDSFLSPILATSNSFQMQNK